MDLRELENYRLSDAVKFNDQLNPRLWGSDEHLLPEVRERLLAIADDFRESLGIDVEVKDITVSGSNAAYTYTPHSDIDLHLVVDLPEADASDVYRELFDAKKYQYNDQHDYKIGGYDVELYVQDARKPHHSQGIYSLMHNDWVRVPSRRKPEVNDISVKSKYEDIGQRIDAAIESGDLSRMDAMAQKIRDMRQAGLDAHGEFGPENLAFKVLRGNGTLEKLRNARKAVQDQEMSLQERKKRRKNTRYGFGGYWYPGFNYGDTAGEAGGDGGGESQHEDYDPNDEPPGPEFKPEMPAGTILVNVSDVYDWYKLGQDISDLKHADPKAYGKGAPQTVLSFGSEPLEHLYKQDLDRLGMKTLDIDRRAKNKDPESAYRMDEQDDVESRLQDFVAFTAQQLNIDHLPRIRFKRDPAWSRRNNTFGRYVPEDHTLYVSLADRHPLDIMRTIAHELTHHRQSEQEHIPDTAGETGSDYENEANALAGIIMRRYADLHPEHFDLSQDLVDETIQTPVAKDTRAHDDYYVFLQKKANMGRPMTRQELEFIKTYRLAQQMRRQVAEASGYIPTEREKNDPRFKMALTVDVHPGQTGKEANKLGLKTDSQGRPQLLMKKLNNLLESVKTDEDCWDGYQQQGMKRKGDRQVPNCVKIDENEEDLFEVKMSPGELEKWAQSEEAAGIQAGFEAELIFRDAGEGDDEEDYEPDYDMDERAYSIDEVVDFFQGGDNGISRSFAQRLQSQLYESFYEWRDEQIEEGWNQNADEIVRDYYDENVWPDEQDNYRERAAEELGIDTSEESEEQREKIEALAKELYRADVETSVDTEDDRYDQARDDYFDTARDGSDYDESDWLEQEYRYMSDIGNEFDVDWPYWRGGERSGGDRTVNDIADSLSRALGGPEVRGSSGYHSILRRPGLWIIEPDGSLDPDDRSDEAGLEVVSPPMPLPDALAALRKVIDWANSNGDAYTNSSTGLHMGVSIPYKGGDVDYVKLIMFMGDKYVLDQFGRAANTYTRSALGKLQDIQRRRRELGEQSTLTAPERTAAAMELMKRNLIELAAEYVRDGVGQDKYTSAHIKDGYIEFRSPGGDYLAMDDRDESALQNTMLRFARAMYLAGRPDLERKEYAKKLYKLIDAQGDEALKLFLDYNTGKINAEELKKQWAQQVLAKEQPPTPAASNEKSYDIYNPATGETLETMTAADDYQAIEYAQNKYSGQGINYKVRIHQVPQKPLNRRASVAKKIATRPTVWHVENTDSGKVILVAAKDTDQARYIARNQDGEFNILFLNDPDSFLVKPATSAEVKQYKVQQADNAKDTEQTQARVTGTTNTQRYRVSWSETRDGEQVTDSLSVDAPNADAAMDSVRSALQAQRRRITSIEAEPVQAQPNVNQQADRLIAQYAAQRSQGEFTGRWQIRNANTGDVLTSVGGIGNSQADANRHAREWAQRQGVTHIPLEVVPEMR
jgi:hypothetical protein